MKILAVCGVGQGTSLLLRMSVEEALKDLGIEAEVDNTDVSSASMGGADLIVVGEYHVDSLRNVETPVLTINDFMDVKEIKEKLQNYLREV
jgi:PTS system ascorbate-specific IIB component